MTEDERAALVRFEERTRELGLAPDRADLLVLFEGWRGLQGQLQRIRRHQPTPPERRPADGPR